MDDETAHRLRAALKACIRADQAADYPERSAEAVLRVMRLKGPIHARQLSLRHLGAAFSTLGTSRIDLAIDVDAAGGRVLRIDLVTASTQDAWEASAGRFETPIGKDGLVGLQPNPRALVTLASRAIERMFSQDGTTTGSRPRGLAETRGITRKALRLLDPARLVTNRLCAQNAPIVLFDADRTGLFQGEVCKSQGIWHATMTDYDNLRELDPRERELAERLEDAVQRIPNNALFAGAAQCGAMVLRDLGVMGSFVRASDVNRVARSARGRDREP